jgi:hypothetical protein
MTDKKKPPKSSEGKVTVKIANIKQDGKSGHFISGNKIHASLRCMAKHRCMAKDDPTITRSKLPEPTEPPPTPRVAKPKK